MNSCTYKNVKTSNRKQIEEQQKWAKCLYRPFTKENAILANKVYKNRLNIIYHY